jgi:hypothetical protein
MNEKPRVLGKIDMEPKPQISFRLMKVAEELNIGKTNIVDFLNSKGLLVDNVPDPILTKSMYEILNKEYGEKSNTINNVNIEPDVIGFNIFIVNQNPSSKYDDKEGIAYDYPSSIPNAKQIRRGDIFIFNMAKKYARELKLDDRTLFGIAKVGDINEYNNNNGDKMIKATYLWYKRFENNISPDEIGGDYRNNQTNSINRIGDRYKISVLIELLKIR